MSDMIRFEATCPQCGKSAWWIAHAMTPHRFDIYCDCRGAK